MNIQAIEDIFNSKIKEAIEEIGDNKTKVTLLKKIANQSIDIALSRSNQYENASVKISAMFSGRGRSWARTTVSNENPVWMSIRHTLTHEILHSDPSSTVYKECTNLLDTFEAAGFAWMRFGSVSKNNLKFHLRMKGSKLEDHIKLYTDSAWIYTGDIENLEGVPHSLGLELGVFEKETQKEKIEVEVSKEELSCFGIQTIEDLI
jgi:hypothetical protein